MHYAAKRTPPLPLLGAGQAQDSQSSFPKRSDKNLDVQLQPFLLERALHVGSIQTSNNSVY